MEASNHAKRRMCQLACQLSPSTFSENQPWVYCGRSLSSVVCSGAVPRRDNRTLFARQVSDSYGPFMRQAQMKKAVDIEDKALLLPVSAQAPCSCCEGRSSSPRDNAKEASTGLPGPSFAAVAPLFGKPALTREHVEKQVTDVPGQTQKPCGPVLSQENGLSSEVKNNIEGLRSAHQLPADVEEMKTALPSVADKMRTDCFGFEWFPRMDVVESGTALVITIELPGVSADGIHVEVVRGSLIVTGSRSNDWWKSSNNGSNGGSTVYHRRELAQGPYRAVWRLPKNGDINGITAEFIDGFLRVLVPKIKITTYL